MVFAFIVTTGSLALLPNGGSDWITAFTPAARRWWDAPWSRGMPQPPYAALLLYPLALLSCRLSTALVNGASILLLARLARRWGGAEWIILPVLISPIGACLFLSGQIDVLLLAGVLLPDGLGILVYILKPQVGLWIVAARWKQLISRALIPGALVGIISLFIWGLWPLPILWHAEHFTSAIWNVTFWPYFIPLGGWCVWRALKTHDEKYGIIASPLLFPYVNLSSYVGLLTVLATQWPRWTLMVWGLTMVTSITIILD
jgi:hypothetical protein